MMLSLCHPCTFPADSECSCQISQVSFLLSSLRIWDSNNDEIRCGHFDCALLGSSEKCKFGRLDLVVIHRACSGNCSFVPLELALLLSWRSLWPFPDIVYGKSSGGCEPTLLAICTIYLPVPHPILTFSVVRRRKDFIDIFTAQSLHWCRKQA